MAEFISTLLHLDAHDMYNSEFFDNSSSGVGGWGDPTNDYQISTGGLKDMFLAYPSPHRIRRNFTLYPYASLNIPPPFNDPASAPPAPADLMINTTMTQQNVDFILNNFEGDFFGFQAYFENTIVVSPSFAILIYLFLVWVG